MPTKAEIHARVLKHFSSITWEAAPRATVCLSCLTALGIPHDTGTPGMSQAPQTCRACGVDVCDTAARRIIGLEHVPAVCPPDTETGIYLVDPDIYPPWSNEYVSSPDNAPNKCVMCSSLRIICIDVKLFRKYRCETCGSEWTDLSVKHS